ncbi:MAG: hypothetical protein JXJ22_04100 [Bacteroidales bacterium]|nr:hypothetical protein [Bacteroidales bacterium]
MSPTINTATYYQIVDGGSSVTAKPGISTSLEYEWISDKKISIGVGIGYHLGILKFNPEFTDPNIVEPSHTETIQIISMNLKSALNLTKGNYLSFDPIIDFQLGRDSQSWIDDQTGIGISFAYGQKLNLSETLYFKLEPRLWVFNLISFEKNDYPLRLTALGIKIGLGFRK